VDLTDGVASRAGESPGPMAARRARRIAGLRDFQTRQQTCTGNPWHYLDRRELSKGALLLEQLRGTASGR
jgi:hypothetical protein